MRIGEHIENPIFVNVLFDIVNNMGTTEKSQEIKNTIFDL